MIADFHRYKIETNCENVQQLLQVINKNYGIALEYGNRLHPCNTTKLALNLNLSVFYYENMLQDKKAINLLQKTIIEALDNIKEVEKQKFNEVSNLLQYMRDNLTLWTIDLKKMPLNSDDN